MALKRLDNPNKYDIGFGLVRAVAQPGSASAWGAEGRGFESRQPDHLHNLSAV